MQKKGTNKNLSFQHRGVSTPKTTENINNLHIGNKRSVHEKSISRYNVQTLRKQKQDSRKSKIASNRILISNTVKVFGIRTS